MADHTAIEWTEATWNPLAGCAHVSSGCDGCYAARDAAGRLKNLPAYTGLAIRTPDGRAKFTGQIRLLPDRLDQPTRWTRPRRIFVNSMSDLFHNGVPVSYVEQVWATMAATPRHTYQVLTKRPRRMAGILTDPAWNVNVEHHLDAAAGNIDWRDGYVGHSTVESQWLPNVWLGTSIEDDRYTFRADHLRATPAAVRFLSLEPLLGPLPSLGLTGIDWVIVGGESGPAARPMNPDWARDIRDRCQAADVPFLFKQWGEWLPLDERLKLDLDAADRKWDRVDACTVVRVGKHVAGRELDGRTWDEYPS